MEQKSADKFKYQAAHGKRRHMDASSHFERQNRHLSSRSFMKDWAYGDNRCCLLMYFVVGGKRKKKNITHRSGYKYTFFCGC
jgi:hypothetical protein